MMSYLLSITDTCSESVMELSEDRGYSRLGELLEQKLWLDNRRKEPSAFCSL